MGPLTAADTGETLALLRIRPLKNVFLEYLVRAGAVGRMPGFFGFRNARRLEGVLMVGPLGGTSLEVMNSDANAPLAEAAHGFLIRPRHIVGAEETTQAFWDAYSRFAVPVRWTRREPVYLINSRDLQACAGPRVEELEPALENDLEEIVENSALQHQEDLKDDPFGADPDGFRRRHASDLREQRWWVLRDRGRIAFQVHLGPENDRTIQIGGVLTVPELRNRGFAFRGLKAIAYQLLEHRPAVSLFCDEDNVAARAVYEKLGFRAVFHYRSWLLDEMEPAS